MKTSAFVTAFLFIAIIFTSCDWNVSRTVIGYGDIESEMIEASDFSGVSVTGTCEVDITIGDSWSVEFHAQPQILEVMTANVRSGILKIGFDPDYNVKTSAEISATIIVPALDFVSITGAGNFNISGEKQSRLDIDITGAGDIDAFDMEVDDCNININGTGNCNVKVNNMLDVHISGVGNVFYMGQPELTTDISGVGNVTATDR